MSISEETQVSLYIKFCRKKSLSGLKNNNFSDIDDLVNESKSLLESNKYSDFLEMKLKVV